MPSEIRNICIPLTLYSKNIQSKPVQINRRLNYLFGHYDWLDVGTDIFAKTGYDFMNIWQHSVNTANMTGFERNYSKQTLYAVRTNRAEEDKYVQDAADFWESLELPPFLFICIM